MAVVCITRPARGFGKGTTMSVSAATIEPNVQSLRARVSNRTRSKLPVQISGTLSLCRPPGKRRPITPAESAVSGNYSCWTPCPPLIDRKARSPSGTLQSSLVERREVRVAYLPQPIPFQVSAFSFRLSGAQVAGVSLPTALWRTVTA